MTKFSLDIARARFERARLARAKLSARAAIVAQGTRHDRASRDRSRHAPRVACVVATRGVEDRSMR